MKTKILSIAMAVAAAFCLSACDDFLDITPTGKVIATTGKEYRALLTYEYKNFPEDRGLATLRSDEMTMDKKSTTADDYSSYFDIWAWNDMNPQPTTSSFGWRRYYHAIYISNYIIEHQNDITEATAEEVNQLTGEAYMMRAYCHFLLVNLYAQPYTAADPTTTRGVPLSLKADVNAVLSCSSVDSVYRCVLSDIASAERLLNVDKWDNGLNYRFNTVSAEALKARVCLYMGDWKGALDAAEKVIEKHGELEDLNDSNAKLPNDYQSVENIVALEEVMNSSYKNIGSPSADFIALYKSGDRRKAKYFKQITSSTSTLLKGGSNEFSCSFRSAEAYLTAAEAVANIGQLDQARTYLKQLMEKRYAPSMYTKYADELDSMDKSALLDEILAERTRELAFEGHRWFDLRRTTRPAMSKTDDRDGKVYILSAGDSRYTLRFPTEAVEANPGIELWK